MTDGTHPHLPWPGTPEYLFAQVHSSRPALDVAAIRAELDRRIARLVERAYHPPVHSDYQYLTPVETHSQLTALRQFRAWLDQEAR